MAKEEIIELVRIQRPIATFNKLENNIAEYSFDLYDEKLDCKFGFDIEVDTNEFKGIIKAGIEALDIIQWIDINPVTFYII